MKRYKRKFDEDNNWMSLLNKIKEYKGNNKKFYLYQLLSTEINKDAYGNTDTLGFSKKGKLIITNENIQVDLSGTDFINFPKNIFKYWEEQEDNKLYIFSKNVCLLLMFI
jgi:hypothetical protein